MADDVDSPPALRAALRHYPGLEDARSSALRGGLLHATYALSTAEAEYIAQRVNPIFAPAIHENIENVTRHIERAGLATPRLRATREGALCVDLAEHGRWRVMTRLPGVTRDTCSAAEAHSAGRLVGAFHRALLDYAAPLQPMGIPFHDTAGYLRGLEDALRAHPDHPRRRDVATLAANVFEAAASWREHEGVPLRVIHGDLKFNNVLLSEGAGPGDVAQVANAAEAIALIDLDTLCRLPLYFDLGDAWRSWCNPRGEDVVRAELDIAVLEASAAGYLEVMDPHLEAEERETLCEGLERISLELAARFATDVLVESYFAWDAARFESAAEHNWVRAQGQWSLHACARACRGEIRAALAG